MPIKLSRHFFYKISKAAEQVVEDKLTPEVKKRITIGAAIVGFGFGADKGAHDYARKLEKSTKYGAPSPDVFHHVFVPAVEHAVFYGAVVQVGMYAIRKKVADVVVNQTTKLGLKEGETVAKTMLPK